jgi:hypothetical protein
MALDKKRVADTMLICPIVYGSLSEPLKKMEDTSTVREQTLPLSFQ